LFCVYSIFAESLTEQKMDKFLYIAMSGAKQGMNALAVSANNLANANTDGFKADMVQARSMQAFGAYTGIFDDGKPRQ
jgi:flagellar hook-associated protein FlgK